MLSLCSPIGSYYTGIDTIHRVCCRRKCRRTSSVSVCATATKVQTVKAQLLKAVANTNRGKSTTAPQRAEILSIIEALEALNPTTNPASSELLSGSWAPVKENAQQSRDATLEGPFLAAFQPLTKSFVRTKNNLQVIDIPNGSVDNVAEFVIADQWKGTLSIRGTARVVPGAQGSETVKVDVEFTKFQLKLAAIDITVPLGWVKAKGWVQTTYLDDKLRVGRGDKGSVFVASRIPKP